MTTFFAFVGALASIYLIFLFYIVLKGNNYHSMVKSAVIADLGSASLPYLEDVRIISRITEMFKAGQPASSTALALSILISHEINSSN